MFERRARSAADGGGREKPPDDLRASSVSVGDGTFGLARPFVNCAIAGC